MGCISTKRNTGLAGSDDAEGFKVGKTIKSESSDSDDETISNENIDKLFESPISVVNNKPFDMAEKYRTINSSNAEIIIKQILKLINRTDLLSNSSEINSESHNQNLVLKAKKRRNEVDELKNISENLQKSIENGVYTVTIYKWIETSNLNLICLYHKTICKKNCILSYQGDENEVDFTKCRTFRNSFYCKKCKCLPDAHTHEHRMPLTSSHEFASISDMKNILTKVNEYIIKTQEKLKIISEEISNENYDIIEIQPYLGIVSMNPDSNIDNQNINIEDKDALVSNTNILILQSIVADKNIKEIEKCLRNESVEGTNQIWVHSNTYRTFCVNSLIECDNKLNNGIWKNTSCQQHKCTKENHIKVPYKLVDTKISSENSLQLCNKKNDIIKEKQQCINKLSSFQDTIKIHYREDNTFKNTIERIISSKTIIETTHTTNQSSRQNNELNFINTLKIKIACYETLKENIKKIKTCKNELKDELETSKWVDTDYHNTICTFHKFVCHEKCNLNYNDKTGTTLFQDCASFYSSKKCKCGCVSEKHMHAKKILVKKTKSIMEPSVLDEKINKYEEKKEEAKKWLVKAQKTIIKKYPDNKELLAQSEKIVSFVKSYENNTVDTITIGTELFLFTNEVKVKISEFEILLNVIKEVEFCIKYSKLVLNVEKWVDTSYHNTVCFFHKTVCHEDCGLDFNDKTGTDYFLKCASFAGSSNCKECHCKSENHMHLRKKIGMTTQIFHNEIEVKLEHRKYTTQLEVCRKELIILESKMHKYNCSDNIYLILSEKIQFYIGYNMNLSNEIQVNGVDRNEIIRFINDLKEKIAEFDVTYVNITEIKLAVEKSSDNVEIGKWVDTNSHNTICTSHKTLCHKSCGLTFNGSTGTNYFIKCLSFSNESVCKICNCGSENHMHARKKYIKYTVDISENHEAIETTINTYYVQFRTIKKVLNNYQQQYNECYYNVDIPQILIRKLNYCLSIELEENILNVNVYQEEIDVIEIMNIIKLNIAEIETISVLIETMIINIENKILKVEVSKWVDTPYHSTVCFNHKTICHEGCGLSFNDKTGTDYFLSCACFGSSKKCNECECVSENHMHVRKIIQKCNEEYSSVSIMSTHIIELYEKRKIILKEFTKIVQKLFKVVPLKEISEMLYEKINLCSKINKNMDMSLRNRPEFTFSLINDTKIKIFEIDILIIKIEELELYAKSSDEKIYTNIWIDTTIENTVCLVHRIVCHESCGLFITDGVSSNILYNCTCFTNTSYCKGCQCSPDFHVLIKKKLIQTVEIFNTKEIIANLLNKYYQQLEEMCGNLAQLKNILKSKNSDLEIIKAIINKAELSIRNSADIIDKRLNSIISQGYHFLNDLKLKISELESYLLNIEKIERSIQNSYNVVHLEKWFDVDYHNTMCSYHRKICHENCSLNYIDRAGDEVFLECGAFNNSINCNFCGCEYRRHKHIKKINKIEAHYYSSEELVIKKEEIIDEVKVKKISILETYTIMQKYFDRSKIPDFIHDKVRSLCSDIYQS
ncbi:hypothetical protein SteCoe_35551 [Stentor coeruleus]|uniref:DUF8206 domain-containing protein n=1 Tax=Stentor coeruleus TaxID=5963 RepID=A0A1R2AS87_9CILI|nr:hypothetical protein SteCoe_35551 [Stentor coeruleus]